MSVAIAWTRLNKKYEKLKKKMAVSKADIDFCKKFRLSWKTVSDWTSPLLWSLFTFSLLSSAYVVNKDVQKKKKSLVF